MKKIIFCLMALIALLVSCVAKDKDKEEDEQRKDLDFQYIKAARKVFKGTLTDDEGWRIDNKVVAVSTDGADSQETTGIKGKIADIFKATKTGRTTIYGMGNNEFISMTFNGKVTSDAKAYSVAQKLDENLYDLFVEYLNTGLLTETMEGKFDFDALVIYKGATDDDLWFSYECTINPTFFSVANVDYIQGTFTARMRNKDGDTFILMPGAFSCLGL